MQWSRELVALTAGVRWRIADLVGIGGEPESWWLAPQIFP
jgi:hypothetical protein